MTYIFKHPSPVGLLTIASDGINITGLWIEGQTYFGEGMELEPKEQNLPVFQVACKWLDNYFVGKNPDSLPPLAPKGGPYRQEVWRMLLEIPYGQTTTYGALAKRLAEESGKKPSAQAVGGAVGHNPISILIPCHRVVGWDGNLTGYAGGVDKKRMLLEVEKGGVNFRWRKITKKKLNRY